MIGDAILRTAPRSSQDVGYPFSLPSHDNLGKILQGRLPPELFARISCVHLGEHSLRPFQDISIVPAYVDRNVTRFTTIPKLLYLPPSAQYPLT